MQFNEDLAAIHGYLCADGYVIKNPPSQKHKYYHIGFRNTNLVLLKDFQQRFKNYFDLTPYITNEGRCRIQNKKIYLKLTKNFNYYSYQWTLPNLPKNLLPLWLRAFFDSEAWVENQVAKSRLIGLECCNYSGITSVSNAISSLGIKNSVKKRKNRVIWRMVICRKENLRKYQQIIGFLHPIKKEKLEAALNSYNQRFK